MRGGGKMASQDYKFFQCDNELEEQVENFLNKYMIVNKLKGREYLKDMIIYSINYHKKKIIGINEGNGTRSDQKTQNNHTLNYGFNLGKQSVSLQDNKIITKKITLNSEWTSLINGIDSTLLTTIQSKIPFANLHNLLITHVNPTPNEIDSNSSSL